MIICAAIKIEHTDIMGNKLEPLIICGHQHGDCLKIENIRIIQGNNRMFAAMPNKKMPNGTYRDCVYPIGKESKLREEIDQAVIDEYNKLYSRIY